MYSLSFVGLRTGGPGTTLEGPQGMGQAGRIHDGNEPAAMPEEQDWRGSGLAGECQDQWITAHWQDNQGFGKENFMLTIKRFLQSEDGPTATEYAVMLALIIIVALTAITTLGQKVSSIFSNVSTALPTGSNG
jgi:pilus assembly protein Flp/PilA